jgi:hypothetical protein
MNGDHLADDAVIRALGPKMVCTRRGHIGADVRPDWGLSGTSKQVSARGRPSYDPIQFGNIGGNLLNVLIGYVLLS